MWSTSTSGCEDRQVHKPGAYLECAFLAISDNLCFHGWQELELVELNCRWGEVDDPCATFTSVPRRVLTLVSEE